MKRSINNQLTTQFSCAMILHNLISSPLFTWRNIFGPIHSSLAVFETYFANLWSSLCLLLLTEMSVIKALLLFKWSWIVGIDEQFAGCFFIFVPTRPTPLETPRAYFWNQALFKRINASNDRHCRAL